jgi:hypothetical protein
MASRLALKIALACGLAAGLGCSKTQDTAPESRLFGSPPVISTVSVVSRQGFAHCDFTAMAQTWIFENFGMTADQYQFVPGPNFVVDAGYAETVVNAHVQDPEDTPTTSDILLVTVSFQIPTLPTPDEISLLMFDDGQSNQFLYKQMYDREGEDCTVDVVNGIYTCGLALNKYYLTTNDPVAGDHVFTRAFAYTTPGADVYSGSGLLLLDDCVASQNHQYPAAGTLVANKTLPLKIEAVDHEGNLTTWPNSPTTTIGPSSLHSATDECILCILTSGNPTVDCKGKTGMNVTSNSASFPPGQICMGL